MSDVKDEDKEKTQSDKIDIDSISDDTKLQFLIAHFSDDQLSRYEQFRRATFLRSSIKKIVNSSVGVSLNQNVLIAISGITKLFVGEVIEEALSVRDGTGETGALKPMHIIEGFRKVQKRNKFIGSLKFSPFA